MAITKITTEVIEDGAITSAKLGSGSVSASSLTGITTDNVSEGSTNVYHTSARARSSLSGSTGVTYDSSTGAISIGQAVGTSDTVSFGQLTVDDITINGSTISNAGSMTLDVGGNLTIDVDGTTIVLNDGGLNWGQMFSTGAGAFNIYSPQSNQDIVFRGNDGGTNIIALTLDMSDAGTANFNSHITLSDSKIAKFGDGADGQIYHDGSHFRLRSSTGNFNVQSDDFHLTDSSNTTLRFRVDADGATDIRYNGSTKLVTTSTGIDVTGELQSDSLDVDGNGDISGNLTLGGYLAGPSTFTIDPAAVGDNTGTVVIAGNLQVDGTTTTINSTTVNIDDLNIQLATGAANAAAADGAGLTVDGASATITYDGTNDTWDFNKDLEVAGGIHLTGANHLLLERGGELRSKDTGGTVRTIARIDGSNNLQYGYSGSGLVQFMGGGSYSERMRIHTNGNIAINHDSAPHTLTVKGTISRVNSTGVQVINLQTDSDSGQIAINNSGGTPRVLLNSVGDSYFNGGSLGIGTTAVTSPGLWYDATNDYLAISHWATPPTPAAMLHLSDNANNIDVPQIRVEGRENPGDTRLDIAVKDPQVRFNLVEGSTDASLGYGLMTFKTNAAANSSYPTRGGFIFETPADSSNLVITNTGNVGIGTSTPQRLVTITDSSAGSAGDDSGILSLTVGTGANTDSKMAFGVDSNSAGWIHVVKPGTNVMPLILNPTTASGGKVGIGMSPTNTLSVKAHNGASSGGINVYHNNGNKVAELVHHGSGDEGRLSLYDSGANTVRIHGETAQASFINSGNLGIGTTSPNHKLDVYSSERFPLRVHRTSSDLSDTQGVGIGFSLRGDTNTSTTDTRAAIMSQYNGDFYIAVDAGGNLNTTDPIDEAALFIEGGNKYVGIGTNEPERALHVVGGIHLPNNNIISWDQANGTLRNAMYVDSGDDMIIGDTNFDDIYFSTGQKTKTVVIKQTTGRMGVGTQSPSSMVHAALPNQALGFNAGFWASANPSDYTTGRGSGITMQNADVYTAGIYGIRQLSSWQGALAFYTHTATSGNTFNSTFTEKMRIGHNGYVGINTTDPQYRLDVRDDIIFAGRAISDYGNINFTNTAAVFSSRGVDQDASETNILRLMRDGTSAVQYAGVADFNMSEWESVGVMSRTQLTLNLGHGDLNSLQTTDVMTWRSNGNVGIGTSSPSAPLHILTNDSTTNTTVNSLMITNLSTGTTTTGFGGEIRFQAERNNGVNQNTGGIRSIAEVNSGTNISSGMAFDTSEVGVNYERLRIRHDGEIRIDNGSNQRPIIKPTNWGYSSGYRVALLGSASTSYSTTGTGSITLSMGYDPSANTNGAFTGDGREILFRRGAQFVTPNSANTGYYLYHVVLKDGAVGLGTNSPQRPLHIIGPDGSSGLNEGNSRAVLFLDNAGATYVNISSGNTSNGGIFFSDPNANNAGAVLYEHLTNSLVLKKNGSEVLRMSGQTNVAYTADGLFHSNARPHTFQSTTGGAFVLGYRDHGSGLYQAAMGLSYDNIDGLGNTAYRDALVLKETSNGGQEHFRVRGDGNVTNTNNSYGQISDERVKTDIVDASSQWDDIKAVRVRKFKFGTAPEGHDFLQIGVISQELEAAGMNGLIEESDPDDSQIAYNPELVGQQVKTVKYSVLYMKAIKALQEAMDRIEQLEARVTELEG